MLDLSENSYCIFGISRWGMILGYDLLSKGKYVFFCDNNDDKLDSIRINGIKCIRPTAIPKDQICIIAVKTEKYRVSIYEQLNELNIENIIIFDELMMERYEKEVEDETYIKAIWYLNMGYEIDMDYPRTFNEKLQWLKLHNRKPEYTMMVDKYEVKKYVADIIGEEYIIPTYGVFNGFDEINFSKLPEQFVLKCTHDSGSTIICRNREKFDKERARFKLSKSLENNYFYNSREWPYKNVKPRIIVEKYMDDQTLKDDGIKCYKSRSLIDYKIHCFNGVPTFVQVISDRDVDMHTANQRFYDFHWKEAGWQFGDYPPSLKEIERPEKLDVMYDISRALSKECDYLRIDLYEINKRVFFGEMTFYPLSGLYKYNRYWGWTDDLMLGRLLHIKKSEIS